MPYLIWILAACALMISAWSGLRTARDQPVIFKQLIVAGGVLVLTLVTMVVAGVQLLRGHAVDDPILFWGYFITALVLYPIAGAWSVAERTRWSSVVLLVTGLAFAVVQWRIYELWVGA